MKHESLKCPKCGGPGLISTSQSGAGSGAVRCPRCLGTGFGVEGCCGHDVDRPVLGDGWHVLSYMTSDKIGVIEVTAAKSIDGIGTIAFWRYDLDALKWVLEHTVCEEAEGADRAPMFGGATEQEVGVSFSPPFIVVKVVPPEQSELFEEFVKTKRQQNLDRLAKKLKKKVAKKKKNKRKNNKKK